MRLGDHQEAFSRDLHTLVGEAYRLGYEIRRGEIERPLILQEIYVKTGKSKTMKSEHGNKCAADLHFFKGGKLCYPPELGKFWESLDERNRWGGSWRGLIESGRSRFVDAPHFERKTS